MEYRNSPNLPGHTAASLARIMLYDRDERRCQIPGFMNGSYGAWFCRYDLARSMTGTADLSACGFEA